MMENDKDVNIEKNENKEKKAKAKKRKTEKGSGKLLQFVQHVLIATAAIVLLMVISGSTIIVHDIYGNRRYTYTIWETDPGEKYEDSDVFCSIYRKAVSDIIRFGVIRSQLETDGEFDRNKRIDVTAYNNRTSPMPDRYVTAEYYLGDLLKWENYGLEYYEDYMDRAELRDFLNSYTSITMLDGDSESGYSTEYYYMTTPAGVYTTDVSGNSILGYIKTDNNDSPTDTPPDNIPSDNEDYTNAEVYANEDYYDGSEYTDEIVIQEEPAVDAPLYYKILINRYKSADGKNIEEYVSDVGRYRELRDNVITAMQSLAYNYDEYLAYSDYYNGYNTNIRYCIERTIGAHTEYMTNMLDNSIDGTVNEEIDVAAFFDEVFDGKLNGSVSRYLYYNPDKMIYESNSDIDEEAIKAIIKDYDYAYPENIRVWIGVDASYLANDAFAEGYEGFHNYVPNIWKWLVLAVSAIILYLVLFIYLTETTGRAVDEEGNACIRLTGFDNITTEAALIFGALSAGVILFALYLSADVVTYDFVDTIWFKILLGAAVFVTDAVFLLFYYSLVRRIKAKTLWKNSYLSRIIKKCHSLFLELYNNSGITIRTWGVYILFLLFNIIMALLTLMMTDYSGIWGLIIIMITVAADMVIGMMIYRDVKERQDILTGIKKIAEGDFSYQVEQENLHGYNTELAESVNSIGNGIKNAVEISMKDERMKTELVTNVSHDIKTPLTSIINYVDLIKREEIDNERVRDYVRILDEKSQRLKQLTDDLVEASKISSGNINLNFEKINLTELLNQTVGEFSEKFEQKGLSIVMNVNASNAVIEADSRRIWRIMENLFNNIYKYALEGTRVYIIVEPSKNKGTIKSGWIEISIKNISATELNCNPTELTERFIRGDESRTTEGSGLGLSIAKNLTEAQNGTFEIQLDGDLFKVILTFPLYSLE